MTNPEQLSSLGRSLLNRRSFLGQTGMSMGALGLSQLLMRDQLLAEDAPRPIRPRSKMEIRTRHAVRISTFLRSRYWWSICRVP